MLATVGARDVRFGDDLPDGAEGWAQFEKAWVAAGWSRLGGARPRGAAR